MASLLSGRCRLGPGGRLLLCGLGALFLLASPASALLTKMKVEVRLEGMPKEQIRSLLYGPYDIATVRRDGYAEVIATEDEYHLLLGEGYEVNVLVPDVYRLWEERYGRRVGTGNLANYHNYDQTNALLQTIANDHPDIARVLNVGMSIQGRVIKGMKISDNPDVDEEEWEVLVTGVHHAREPITVEIPLAVLQNLTDNYGIDPDITALVDNREVYVVPIVNPDGFVYVDNTDPYWRKNRRDNPGPCFGVDPNRNYSYNWGFDDFGSSPDPCSEVYRGASPTSEPEIQAIQNLGDAHEFTIAISHHSYGDLVLFPWGYTTSPTPDHAVFTALGSALSALHGYAAGQSSVILYGTNGDFDDWFYGEQTTKPKALSFTFETGPDFWPPVGQIPTLTQEGLDHTMYLIDVADAPYGALPPAAPVLLAMATDEDGAYPVAWNNSNRGQRDMPVSYDLDEIQGVTLIEDNLENAGVNWTRNGFALVTSRYHSYNHSMWSGSSNNRNATMTANNSYGVQPGDSLKFWAWYDIETDWDYAYVDVSTDGGTSWQPIPGNITTNYNPNGPNQGNGITGISGGGGTPVWVQGRFDLSSFAGQSIFLRFRYVTDGAVLEAGFYVDDIDPVLTFSTVVNLATSYPDTVFNVTGRTPGTYYYRVRGRDAQGQLSTWSALEDIVVTGLPTLSADLVPDAVSVPQGGTLGFQATITNISGSPQTFDAWLDALLIGGSPYAGNPIAGPVNLTLGPGEFVTQHVNLRVPRRAPVGGPYTMLLRAGTHPGDIRAEDSFQFSVTPASDVASAAGQGTGEEWSVDGPLFTPAHGGTRAGLLAGAPLPKAYALGGNFPNPFNPSTVIPFAVPGSAGDEVAVSLRVYTLRGELVRTLVTGALAPGTYQVHWDGRDGRGSEVSSGVYLYRLEAEGFAATRRMVLLK